MTRKFCTQLHHKLQAEQNCTQLLCRVYSKYKHTRHHKQGQALVPGAKPTLWDAPFPKVRRTDEVRQCLILLSHKAAEHKQTAKCTLAGLSNIVVLPQSLPVLPLAQRSSWFSVLSSYCQAKLSNEWGCTSAERRIWFNIPVTLWT